MVPISKKDTWSQYWVWWRCGLASRTCSPCCTDFAELKVVWRCRKPWEGGYLKKKEEYSLTSGFCKLESRCGSRSAEMGPQGWFVFSPVEHPFSCQLSLFLSWNGEELNSTTWSLPSLTKTVHLMVAYF